MRIVSWIDYLTANCGYKMKLDYNKKPKPFLTRMKILWYCLIMAIPQRGFRESLHSSQ